MKAIVTGGAGFLGQHITAALDEAGWDTVVLDLKFSRLHDLRFPHLVAQRFAEHADADVCVHLAAKVGRLFGEDDPMETVTDNIGITALVAQACAQHEIRLAYASTSEVYGDNGSRICDEEDGPWTLPHNLYGISKKMGEDVCRHYCPDELTIMRFSMPYGPGLPAGRGRAAIINMLHQALHGKTITVHDGAERSWCYVTDTARAVLLAIGNPGIYNIGRDDAAVSMLKVAYIACAITGQRNHLIQMVSPPANQTVVKRLATDRIRSLGWTPKVELEEGMERTLEWVRSLDEMAA